MASTRSILGLMNINMTSIEGGRKFRSKALTLVLRPTTKILGLVDVRAARLAR